MRRGNKKESGRLKAKEGDGKGGGEYGVVRLGETRSGRKEEKEEA